MSKRSNQSFTSWLQDGADALNMLLTKIHDNEIDEDDLDENLKSCLEATCENASAEVDQILLELRERRESEAVPYDGYAEFRHLQHERI